MKVERWISFDEAETYQEVDGWEEPYYTAIAEAVVESNLRIAGDRHQESHIPVFTDGTVSTHTFRDWGEMQADIWNTVEPNADYNYMDFYMQGSGRGTHVAT